MIRALAVVIVFVAATAMPPVAQAQGASYCRPGQAPEFVLGFAALKARVGAPMGNPIECEHANPENGDSLQQTTTGLSFYRKSTNTPTFTDGYNHWGLTPLGLVTWVGSSVDPPGTAVAPTSPAPTVSAPAPAPAAPRQGLNPSWYLPRDGEISSGYRQDVSRNVGEDRRPGVFGRWYERGAGPATEILQVMVAVGADSAAASRGYAARVRQFADNGYRIYPGDLPSHLDESLTVAYKAEDGVGQFVTLHRIGSILLDLVYTSAKEANTDELLTVIQPMQARARAYPTGYR